MDENVTSEAPEPVVPEPASAPKPKKRHWLVALMLDLGSTVVPAIVIALVIHVFLAQATRVYGQSMEPNLHTNQRLVIEKLSYRWHGPQRGDVVVLHDPGGSPELLIKRVIGLPGERVTIADGRVYIDGVALDEPYLTQSTQGSGRSWVVPPLSVFVMGDNRSASRDSRIFGTVPLNQIVGHAIFRYWPPEQIGAVR
jgi:signal peptidase I